MNRLKTAQRPESSGGKQFGRPPAPNMEERAAVVRRLDAGANIAEIAHEFKTTRQTIMRVKEAALKLSSQQKERLLFEAYSDGISRS